MPTLLLNARTEKLFRKTIVHSQVPTTTDITTQKPESPGWKVLKHTAVLLQTSGRGLQNDDERLSKRRQSFTAMRCQDVFDAGPHQQDGRVKGGHTHRYKIWLVHEPALRVDKCDICQLSFLNDGRVSCNL